VLINNQFFIDDPTIESKIIEKNVVCPIQLGSIHINSDGSLSACKFDTQTYGHIGD
jgi:hypothetical protein